MYVWYIICWTGQTKALLVCDDLSSVDHAYSRMSPFIIHLHHARECINGSYQINLQYHAICQYTREGFKISYRAREFVAVLARPNTKVYEQWIYRLHEILQPSAVRRFLWQNKVNLFTRYESTQPRLSESTFYPGAYCLLLTNLGHRV